MTVTRHDDDLSPTQHKAIAALLSQPTIARAAEQAGCSESSIYRWLDTPTFDAAYRVARRKAVRAATARLQYASGAAVATLVNLMASPTAAPAIKLTAACKILDLAMRAVELDDLDARLSALEAQQEATR